MIKKLWLKWQGFLCRLFGHNFCAYDLDTDKCLNCGAERKAGRNWQ